MVDEPVPEVGGLAGGKGHLQGLHIVGGPHVIGHRMTDDAPRVYIHDQDNIEELVVDTKVRDVTCPKLVIASDNFASQQVTIATEGARKRSTALIPEDFGLKAVFEADADEGVASHRLGLIQIVHRTQSHGRVNFPDLQHQTHQHTLLLLAGMLTLHGLVVRLLADTTIRVDSVHRIRVSGQGLPVELYGLGLKFLRFAVAI
jgi:hypothetical protein